ncbi:LysR family transcriptional regulator [Gordonibacter massiliensis (ex Traore et al. 2017)]|uniref:LysR family transcriptional regulator n=1 Tax=Gordonibacter massiliensis (ex Traore et al. 2017) TaxID=1841863 RepID=UPI001C8C4511|nr:LysR family transcriptional regulator [Gordonibacter massiliensis (ex Traore et al. 2017)]
MDAAIQKYRAFVATVELGSFTKAAEALSYSQSGVSRMVADLEREWKVALLERGRGGVRLTSEGTRLLPLVRRVCDEHARLQAQVDDLNGLQSGLIRIGTFSSVATHWLPNVISAFQKDYPNIDYELLLGDYAEIEEWVREGRVDCGFLRLPACADLEVLPLDRDELLAVLPEGHRLVSRASVSAAELCEEPFMLLEKGDSTAVSEVFERDGLVPRAHFTTWDDYAIMAMVESGLGVSVLPELILRRAPYRIVAKPLDEPVFRAIGLVLRSREAASLATQRFLEYLDCR